jgi:2-oxoacid:acceptor oxidoreductase gamma subunit (pyruvate/2-ketoisovalerate family)
MLEVKFQGRGGQGAVTASEILGRAFFLEGRYPQAFSLFGGERRGAPVYGFLRVDECPILLKCQIKQPDHVVVFDWSIADEEEILREIKPGGSVLINTKAGIDRFPKLKTCTLGLIDASAIAKNQSLGDNFNTAILGAYVRLTGLIKLETLILVVEQMVPSKVESNIRAVRRAYETVAIHLRQEIL